MGVPRAGRLGRGAGAGFASHPRAARTALGLAVRAAPPALAGFALGTFATAVVPIGLAWLTKLVLDTLTEAEAEPARLLPPAVALAVVGLAAGLLPHVVRYLRNQTERATGLLAQDRLYAAVERFRGLARFEDPAFQDRLRLAQQAAGVTSSQLVGDLVGVLAALLTISGFLGSLLAISPALALVVTGSAVPAMAAEVAMARRRAELAWGLGPTERREFFYGSLLADRRAAVEVRLFGIGAFLRGRMRSERAEANAARHRLDRRDLSLQACLGGLSAVVAGAGLLWTVFAAYQGRLSIGDLSMFVAAVAGVQAALSGIALLLGTCHRQLLLFSHYVAVTTAGPDLPQPSRPVPVPPLRSGIEFRDVWFRYSPDHPWILRGVDLRLPAEGSVALVGRNGTGKSTLVKLLCRFYDPCRGAILWDGIDVREFDVGELRRRVGAVFQDFMQYDLSAAENVALGDIEAVHDRPRIERAARFAGVHRTLATLPRGYDTLLTRLFKPAGEEDDAATGVLLSGGQWQRVALARAFLRLDCDLMILDEPSAGLDAVAEHEVHSAVRNRREGRCTLLISHRLGAIRGVGRIVVLADGRVSEQGTHEELLAADGEYAALFRLQASGYLSGDEPPVAVPVPAGRGEEGREV